MVGRIITCGECVAEGAAFLAELEPRFADALKLTGELPLRLRSDGFEALLDAIVSQQISVAAARSISKRLKDAQLIAPKDVVAAQARSYDFNKSSFENDLSKSQRNA